MKAVVICPDRRPEVSFLARTTPLALVPYLGAPVLFLVLADLADRGVRTVTILAPDRPDQIRLAVGRGERWGMAVEVLAEGTEPGVAEVRRRFSVGGPGWVGEPYAVVIADRVLEEGREKLFSGCGIFHGAAVAGMGAAGARRVGMREAVPGVWVGLRVKVDSTAKVVPPCWIGNDVWVRGRATVGPGTVIEESALVDHDVEVVGSWVGPRTYLGAMVHLRHSMAWSDGLFSLDTGSFTEIVDPFLIGDLRGAPGFARGSPWHGRAAAFLIMVVTWIVPIVAFFKKRGGREGLFLKKSAVVPAAVLSGSSVREMSYWELEGFSGLARRWPQLWNIVRGEFTWVGNRPLTREQASSLETEFEKLWLTAPIGLVSLADVHGCAGSFSDEERAHSSYYAVRAGASLDRSVLGWLLRRCWPG